MSSSSAIASTSFPDISSRASPPPPNMPSAFYDIPLQNESILKERRIRDILEDELRNFSFMNQPAIKHGQQQCLVLLTISVALAAIGMVLWFALAGRTMPSATLVSSVISCSGYILWGVFLCYTKYQNCKKYYGGVF